jgi:hypothetical protein
MVKIASFLQLKNVQVNKNGLKINGLYGLSIAYSDLVQGRYNFFYSKD